MSSNRQVQRYRNNLKGKYDGSKNMKLRFVQGISAVLIISIITFRFVVGTSTVDGHSMDPTLTNGQRLFFLRILPIYEVGDIISFRMPSGDYYVKRVVARQGDVVSVEKGHIKVNGKKLNEPYALGKTEVQEDTVVYPYTVGKNAYFVVGDNREHSIDSRSFGAIVKYQIRGKILGSYGEKVVPANTEDEDNIAEAAATEDQDKKDNKKESKKSSKKVFNKLSKKLSSIKDKIKLDKLSKPFKAAGSKISSAFKDIDIKEKLSGISEALGKIGDGFLSLFDSLKDKLPLH